jgi:hypothetical protein
MSCAVADPVLATMRSIRTDSPGATLWRFNESPTVTCEAEDTKASAW